MLWGWITATASGFSLILCLRGNVLKPVAFIQLLLVLVLAENIRQPLYRTHSANHIANYKNVNLADLQKQISDLKELVCSHVIKTTNKQDDRYNSVFPDFSKAGHNTSRCISKNRRNASEKRRTAKKRELNEKFLKTFSNHQLTDTQISVLSRGQCIRTAVTNKTKIKRQLSRDFELFARRMRLQYIFHWQNKESHLFHVKSNWMPPVQQSGSTIRFNNLKTI